MTFMTIRADVIMLMLQNVMRQFIVHVLLTAMAALSGGLIFITKRSPDGYSHLITIYKQLIMGVPMYGF